MADLQPTPPQNWRDFFDEQADTYEQNAFTKNTRVEVDFLLDLFPLEEGARILDLGCGTGRHAIELAARGFAVTGVDFSPRMLEVARRNAADRGVRVEWVLADARAYRGEHPFDLVICLCEGAFNLADFRENPVMHDLAVLETAAVHAMPGAGFVLTALNGYRIIRQLNDDAVAQGQFDPATMLATYVDEWSLPTGPKQVVVRERLYIPPEVCAMLQIKGFQIDAVYGGTAGEWGKRPLKLDEIEVMYVCRRADR